MGCGGSKQAVAGAAVAAVTPCPGVPEPANSVKCSGGGNLHTSQRLSLPGQQLEDKLRSLHATSGPLEAQPLEADLIGASSDGCSDASTKSSAVKVAVVIRPLLEFEKEKGASSIVVMKSPSQISIVRPSVGLYDTAAPEFSFDRVYVADGPSAHVNLFNDCVAKVVDGFTDGFNGTVLAYGQTGAGKTYTMGTGIRSPGALACPGVIPNAIDRLFEYVAIAKDDYNIMLKVSFVEIYNEAIQDLLIAPGALYGPRQTPFGSDKVVMGAPSISVPPVSLREGSKGEVQLEGAMEVSVRTKEEVLMILEAGNANRATAAHRLNSESSRSHAIFSLTMQQRAKPSSVDKLPEEVRFLRSKLHLVDLAGSERAKETGSTGQRFMEGVNINKGLLELGNVITALTEGTARRHIPYRNSKLTRLLQDSLGGNSETLFVACISPASLSHDHTISTLRYANRAMKIQNSLHMNNKLTAEEEIAYLRGLVTQLQGENCCLKERLSEAGLPC